MEKEFIDLLELQTRLKKGVELLFPNRLWIKAEVSAVKARSGGHCYLELSQSDESGLVAKVNAIIWSSKYRFIAPYFESVTGSSLQEGMVVLVEVQVNFSQLYGLSLIINDIDPEFSLGVKELERQQTIERLQKEGLMELQKELALPVLPYSFAVISASDAAGYRDFVRHLDENPYGFKVALQLYPALMQGVECPESIISALDAIMDSGKEYDAVLILRGGGSKLDLACFDDYQLAAVIAQYPLPVLTAIGHDQDFHVCDMVAHGYVKTPTALADFILPHLGWLQNHFRRIPKAGQIHFRFRLWPLGRNLAAPRLRKQSDGSDRRAGNDGRNVPESHRPDDRHRPAHDFHRLQAGCHLACGGHGLHPFHPVFPESIPGAAVALPQETG